MTFEKAASAILSAKYQFAKTMPEHPHEYTLRRTWADQELFNEVVIFIRDHSYIERFKGRTYQMFNLNGYKYWTMGAPIDQTILINRAEIKYKSDYDGKAEDYIRLFDTEESRKEDDALFKLLDISGKILDIGCGGPGLVINQVKPLPEMYYGIDPSEDMLRAFERRHPGYHNLMIATAEEFYLPVKFNTILALYGTPAYFKVDIHDRLMNMLAPGGVMYLMYYKKGYFPITHKALNINQEYHFMELPTETIEFNNYLIKIYRS